jgi:ketosteroid isomerase-like protein
MKIKSIPLLLVGVTLATCVNTELLRAGDEKSKDAEQAIKKLEKEWADALVKRDQAVIDRIESSDWMLADAEGNLVSKAKTDADLKSGAVAFESVQNDELKVRVFGDTAIAYGLVTEKMKFQGKDTSGQYRFTDVFIRRDGRWQAISTHLSRVAKQ